MKSSEEVQIALHEVLENHPRYTTLKQLVDALREANNYMPEKKLAETLGLTPANFSSAIRLNPYRTAEKICVANPFGFSEKEGSAAFARQILFSKTPEKRFWSHRLIDASRQAVIENVVDKVARYQQGTLSESDLPLFKDALRGLYPIKQFDKHAITKAMLEVEATRVTGGEAPSISEDDRKELPRRIGKIFCNLKPRLEEYALLLEAAGVPEEKAGAFRQLPAGPIKKQTAFTENFRTLLQLHGERNADGSPNRSAFARYTKLVDPAKEGIPNNTVYNLLHSSSPTQHSMRRLAQAFTRKITGKDGTSAQDVPEAVKNLIEAAGFAPEQIFRNAHEVIAAATPDMPIFELWRDLRLASDINQPISEWIKNTDLPFVSYFGWENHRSFPEKESILPINEQLIVRIESLLPKRTDGQPDILTDAEKDKIRAIARYNLEQRQATREEINTSKNALVAETKRRLHAGRRGEGRT